MTGIEIFNFCAVVACGILFFPFIIWMCDEKKDKEGRVNVPGLIMLGMMLLVPVVNFISLLTSL